MQFALACYSCCIVVTQIAMTMKMSVGMEKARSETGTEGRMRSQVAAVPAQEE